jgi:murein DD-endopeptidase MepM/ murein hydrolase activator NlpD
VDSRPSELDPYPRFRRDLGSAVLWERSLHRSQGRRERARRARRNAPRQKGVTLAAGAAIFASPVLAPLAASASSARPGVTKTEVAQKAAVSGEETALLSYGDTGDAVMAVQHELNIVEDGIFGPQTEAAVKSWQRGQGLAATGVVDARTWASLFQAKVLFYDDSATSASSSSSSSSVPVSYTGSTEEPEATGGPDLSDRVEVKDELTDSSSGAPSTTEGSAPAPEAAPESTPLSTGGDGCSTNGHIVAPVSGGTVTGNFGEDRGDHAHSGTDIAVPTGTTVRAADCGTVSISGVESGYGQMVCIQHAGETTTCYAHLSERDVSVSEYVKAGQKIGEVGCTGNCTGPHVHFEVRRNGTATDPSPYLAGARSVNGQTATMAHGSGGIGDATPAQQAEVFGDTGGTAAPTPTKHQQLARPATPATTTPAAPSGAATTSTTTTVAAGGTATTTGTASAPATTTSSDAATTGSADTATTDPAATDTASAGGSTASSDTTTAPATTTAPTDTTSATTTASEDAASTGATTTSSEAATAPAEAAAPAPAATAPAEAAAPEPAAPAAPAAEAPAPASVAPAEPAAPAPGPAAPAAPAAEAPAPAPAAPAEPAAPAAEAPTAPAAPAAPAAAQAPAPAAETPEPAVEASAQGAGADAAATGGVAAP